MLRDLRPACEVRDLEPDEKQILIKGELSLDNFGVEVVVPALTALFSDATDKSGRDFIPALSTKLCHNSRKELVLFLTPGIVSYIKPAAQLKVAFGTAVL